MSCRYRTSEESGFTIPEVIIAGVILVIIGVGTLETFTVATQINRGNNLRMQALSVLQQEVEHYRSLKFVPGLETTADLAVHRPVHLRVGNHTRPNRTSKDGRVFTITAQITNFPNVDAGDSSEEQVEYKEITIIATPLIAETGWLQNMNTRVTVQRVRAN